MMLHFGVRVLVLMVLASSGAAASAAHPPDPKLSAYSSAKIVQQNDPANSLTGLHLFVRAGLDRQAPAQSGIAALVAECVLRSSPSPGAGSLRSYVTAQGGSISYDVDGQSVRFYLEGTTQDFRRSVDALEAVLRNPDLGAQTVSQARALLNEKSAESEKIPLTVGLEILNAALFADSDAGLPQYGSPATLAGVTSADARAFYRAYYRRDGAVISAVGNLSELRGADFETVLDALPPGGSRRVQVALVPLAGSSHRVVARRDIGVPWIVAGFPAPPPESRDFGAMLVFASVVDNMLENQGITTRPMSERSFGALYNFDQRPASFVVYANGATGDPSKTLATVFSVLTMFSHSSLNKEALQRTKAVAAGSFANSAVTLEDRSWLAANFVSQGLRPDYLSRALDAIAKTSAADVQRVGTRYLQNPTLAYVLPRDNNR
ncbi:MAG: insulinase family protein [Candidatus Eremiobacteraeota bacterium]|nr:insulinase family protein [Candidatus Eremiobacteraeota bacterium]